MGSPTHLSVIAAIDRPRGIRELADRLEAPYDTVYTAVRQLERQGLVVTAKSAGSVKVNAGSGVLVDRAKAVIRDVPRDDWDGILRGDWPMMIHVLDRVHTARLTSEICGKSLSAVHHMIDRLLSQGVLLKGGGRFTLPPWSEFAGPGIQVGEGVVIAAGKYRVNPRLFALSEFLDEMIRLRAVSTVRKASPDATLVWNLGPEILYKSVQEPEGRNTRPGALSAFAQYGIDLYSPTPYWFTSIREPTTADFILQTLLLQPADPVRWSYAALLLERVWRDEGRSVIDELRSKQVIYDDPDRPGHMREATQALIGFVTDREGDARFLPWHEHERYRRQYGLPEGGEPLA